MPLPDLVIALIFVLGVKFGSPVRTFHEIDMLMDAMSPVPQCIHTMVEAGWNKPRHCRLWAMWMCLCDMAEND